MKKYLNILSAIILGMSGVTFIATARGQLDSTRDAATPKIISPDEAAKKYPPPAGKKEYPPAVALPTSSGGFYRSPYSSQVYRCTKKEGCGVGALVLDEIAKKVFRIPPG
jgi:hypothetical protein